jgi:ketosteroid isomerase-like protein
MGSILAEISRKGTNQMKRISAVAALVTVATSLALGQMADKQEKTKSGKAGIEQTLMQMERDWTEAALKKDTAALDKILADDWAGQSPTGVSTKAQSLADLKSADYKLESQTLGEMKVRVFGNTAVVTGSDDEKSSYKGKDTSGHYLWTDVYVKRHGRWQAAASQATLMTQQ